MRKMKSLMKRIIVLAMLPVAQLLAFLLQHVREIEPFFKIFRRSGFYFLRKHYYLPIPDEGDMKCLRNSELVGIKMNDEQQLAFTNDVILAYKDEFSSFPAHATDDPVRYHLVNGGFMAGDGNAYYAIIRHLRPKRIIEIGSGNSTLLALHAIDKNREMLPEYGCKFIAIDPYPVDYLKTLSRMVELKECKLQELPLDYFDQLGSGDILFIDSSHVLRSGGDVWMEYCEIIPRLRSGVYVHVHDISLPKPYPSVYYDQHLYWNEQYVLQALLTNNDKLEVVWAGTYLFHKYPEKMSVAFSPEYELMRKTYPLAESASFWMRVK